MAEATNPQLQRLLASLNGYAPSTHSGRVDDDGNDQSHGIRFTPNPSHLALTSPIPGLGLLPPDTAPPRVTKNQTPPLRSASTAQSLQTPSIHETRSNTPSASSRLNSPAPNIPDASTITTWPAALKHITKHLANDEKVSSRVRHLISEQHKHEQQWWDGREALLSLHKSRFGTSAQVSALLRSLGGKDTLSAPNDPQANQAESDSYDAKVYKSLISMTADFDRQLRAMGIPFFAIKHELVFLGDGKERPSAARGRLDRGELRELQKRMLQYLEDLFGD